MAWLLIINDVENYRPKFAKPMGGYGFLPEADYFSDAEQAAVIAGRGERWIHELDATRLDALARMVADAQVIIQVQSGAATVTEKPYWLPVHVHDLDTRGWE